MARLPFPQFHHDFVAGVRRPADVTRRRHIDVVWNARVVRNNIKKLIAPLEGADDLSPPAFQDADNRAGVLAVALWPQSAGSHVPPHEHAVLVQSRGRGILRDNDFFESRIVRLEEPFTLAVDLNSSGNQIGLAGGHVAISLEADDPSGLLQRAQDTLEFLLLTGPQAEVSEEFRNIQRNVIFSAEPS